MQTSTARTSCGSNSTSLTFCALGRSCIYCQLLALRLFGVVALFQLFFFDLTQFFGGFRLVHQTVTQWPSSKQQRPNAIQDLCDALNKASKYYSKAALCVQRSAVVTCLLRSSGVSAETVIACRKVPFKVLRNRSKKQFNSYYSVPKTPNKTSICFRIEASINFFLSLS